MLVVVLLALRFIPITKGEVLGKFCDDNTANSTYHENLLRLSTTLQKNTSSTPFLFAKGSVGAYPDAVYGLERCLGDANASVCSDCIRNALESAQQLCTNNREVTIFYDTCLLRFSNWDTAIVGSGSYGDNSYYAVIDTMDKTGNTERMLPGWNASNITNVIQVLLQETSNAAAYMFFKGRVVTGFMEATSTNPLLYSMAQCTEDMSSLECLNCLEYISGIAIGNFTGQQRGQVLSLRCNLRYDTAVFYSGAPMWRITPPVVSVTAPAQGAMPSPKHKSKQINSLFHCIAFTETTCC